MAQLPQTRHLLLVETLTRAALAASVAALAGAVVATQYVGAEVFSVVVPGLVGMAAAGAATAAAPTGGGPRHRLVLAVAALYGVVGTAYGFVFVPGGQSPFGPPGQVLPPYAAAAAGPWVWALVAGPGRQPAGRRTRLK